MGLYVAVLATPSRLYHQIWLKVYVEPVPRRIYLDFISRGVGIMK